jgi:HD-GYP domain-containing protein (c-di-GMP phosphodiesterase class II)
MDGVTNALNNANLYRYIAKPWEKEDLFMTVTEAVRSFNKDRELERYNAELIRLYDDFVGTMVTALDSRDTTTAGHSKRLAGYVMQMADSINKVKTGPFAEVFFDDAQKKELYYAALLHDIGKIGVRESVLLKQYRLSEEQQSAIIYRFAFFKESLKEKLIKNTITESENKILEHIDEDCAFIIEISRRNFATAKEFERVKDIAEIKFVDIDCEEKNILNDFEVENLLIERGNLTKSEREIINSHAKITYDILKNVFWTKSLSKVAKIAAGHHERMDGSGYYEGISGNDIMLETRILAFFDVFEALTAQDRPYKPPMPIEKAIGILEQEVAMNHLDKDVFEIFISEKVYKIYKEELESKSMVR